MTQRLVPPLSDQRIDEAVRGAAEGHRDGIVRLLRDWPELRTHPQVAAALSALGTDVLGRLDELLGVRRRGRPPKQEDLYRTYAAVEGACRRHGCARDEGCEIVAREVADAVAEARPEDVERGLLQLNRDGIPAYLLPLMTTLDTDAVQAWATRQRPAERDASDFPFELVNPSTIRRRDQDARARLAKLRAVGMNAHVVDVLFVGPEGGWETRAFGGIEARDPVDAAAVPSVSDGRHVVGVLPVESMHPFEPGPPRPGRLRAIFRGRGRPRAGPERSREG